MLNKLTPIPYAVAAAAVLSATWAPAAIAQSYPTRPIRLIVPYPAGGPTDFVGRTVAQKLSETLGQQVVVDNRAGASAMIGHELGAKATPDGYTLLFATGGGMVIAPLAVAKPAYDASKDFAAVSLLVISPQIIVAHPSFPGNTIKELIAAAKAKPGAYNFASVGTGSPNHLGGELLKAMANIDVVHVPYKGAGPMLVDLLGGRLSFTVLDIGSLLPHVQAGKLKVLATAGTKRATQMPDVPTFKEAGLDGFEVISWMGIFLPAKTPEPVRRAWADALQRHLTSPAIATNFATIGLIPDYLGPEDFAKTIERDTAAWKALITVAKITAN